MIVPAATLVQSAATVCYRMCLNGVGKGEVGAALGTHCGHKLLHIAVADSQAQIIGIGKGVI